MARFVRVGSIQFSAFADLQWGEPESIEKVLCMTRNDLNSSGKAMRTAARTSVRSRRFIRSVRPYEVHMNNHAIAEV